MPAFALTPVAGFPPPTPAEFPDFIQFQNEGANLGGSDADTVDFVGAGVTATRGTGANANKVTVTIPGGGGGGSAPVLAVSLQGAADGPIGDGLAGEIYFDNWNGTVRQTSADASWSEANNRIEFARTGLYEVVVTTEIDAQGQFPNVTTRYGTRVESALSPVESRYNLPATTSGFWDDPGFIAYTDTFLVNVDDIGVDFVTPRVFTANYLSAGTETASFSALVIVRRIGDAFSGY